MTGAQAGASIVQQALGVLAPFLILQYSLSAAQLGALFTLLYLGSATFTAVSGVLTDRLGERTMVAISGTIMTIALVAAAAIPNYVWLVCWMFLYGAGYAAQTPAGGRAILTWFTRDRGFAMGVRQTGVPLGGLIGAAFMPFVAFRFGGYRGALFATAIIVAVSTAAACLLYRDAPVDRPPLVNMRELLAGMRRLARDPRLVAVTLTCMVLVNTQIAANSFLTLTAIHTIHATPAYATAAFACSFTAATIARLFWGWFSDRFMPGNRIGLLGILAALAGVATLIFAVLGPGLAAFLIPSAMFIGFVGVGWNGVMAAALAEIGGQDRAGSALGLNLTVIYGVSALSPLLFGSITDHTSLKTAWFCVTALCFAGVLPVIWLKGLQRRGVAGSSI